LSGGDVIIVIGGDNKYKGEDEEEREVISRWAKRKVFSQFSEEYLDGRKSFIFSWNKKHREIHEKALSHHFDPNKNGRKFEYQPDQRKEQPEAATPPPSRLKELIPPFRRCFSLSGEQQYESEPPLKPESSLRHYGDLSSGLESPKDARILVLICGSSSLSKQDELRVEKVVKDYVNETEKIVAGWFKRGIVNLEPDALLQLLTLSSDVTRIGPNQGNSSEWGLHRETDRQVQALQPRRATANYPATRGRAHQETVILECRLFYGKNFQSRLDLLNKIHDSKVVDSIYANLFEKYKTIALAFVKFFTDTSGYLRYTVEIRSAEDPDVEGVQIADNETLLLSTLVRYGNVSFENGDVQFHRVDFNLPPGIADDLKSVFERYPKVSLFIVRNEKGELRCHYITGAFNKVLGIVLIK
ncbi:unnamed protein product, partial [Pocillopora meandrina]